mmetsp:Transcript_2851/g.10374  ORF Transcript_2851/g.10374 Transcript_2851/m.10374 type:complete len:319 (-) Transcript_2851:1940-2896(-)
MRCGGEGPCRNVYPRVDPACIMLVTAGDHILLGRNQRWPEGRFSLLAGFCELGETLEQAAGREVLEESGVEVPCANWSYRASSPWPFPQSVMVGYEAEAAPGRVYAPRFASAGAGPFALPQQTRADESELADVRWFHRRYVRAALRLDDNCTPGSGGLRAADAPERFHIPGKASLANHLIMGWARAGYVAAAEARGVRSVALDGEGEFKYILAKLTLEEGEEEATTSALVLRGAKAAPYHTDIFKKTLAELGAVEAGGGSGRLPVLEPLGGGKVCVDAAGESIHVFGESGAYGAADHTLAKHLLAEAFPLWDLSCEKQ